ncbi:hypothetical protein [Acrocarpospora corrugata]|nr:hypothetical protein [Acrocarpospora corrugata]
MNDPVSALCTAGGTGLKTAVLDLPGKWASGVRAERKNRGEPVAARGAPVAMGSAKEVAGGNGCCAGPEDTMGEGCGGTAVSDGSGGDAGGWVALTIDTRSAAGSVHPAERHVVIIVWNGVLDQDGTRSVENHEESQRRADERGAQVVDMLLRLDARSGRLCRAGQ